MASIQQRSKPSSFCIVELSFIAKIMFSCNFFQSILWGGKGEIEEVKRKFYNKISLFITRRNINIINRLIENILTFEA